jgi:geranylgeranyl reductase family protein
MQSMYDVAVVGSGPAGSSTAHYLAQAGYSVLMLDKDDFPRDKTCGDGLTPRALRVLEDMEILSEVEQAGFRVNGLKIYAQSGASISASIPAHLDFPAYLLIVPRERLDDIIRKRAVQSGAHFESPARVLALHNEPNCVRLTVERGGSLSERRARMVVLAIGAYTRLLLDTGIMKRPANPIIAIRAYYQGMRSLDDHIQVHFEDVPMPGYGWVFPLGRDSANVGIGIWGHAEMRASLRTAMHDFVHSQRLQPMLSGAEQVGALKSYPLRIDFATSPTHGERVLLVGETAGLVNPLSGEGIDFALESGRLAADFLAKAFATDRHGAENLGSYDRLLRAEYQSTFRILGLLRHAYVNSFAMNRMIKLCQKNPKVRDLAVGVLMSQQHPLALLQPGLLRQLLLGA